MSSNGPQVAAKIQARGKILSAGIDAATKSTGVFIRAEAARTSPTGKGYSGAGDLRAGWQGPIHVGKWAYEVKNEVKHAMFAEKGFMLTQGGLAAMAKKGIDLPASGEGVPRPIAGRHMLENAVHKAEPMHKAAIAAVMRKALR